MRDQLIATYGVQTVQSGGLRVYTTIDPAFQRAAQKAIKDTLYLKDDPAAAVVSINPANGAIRAMTSVYPGRTKNQFNLVAQARRQAGSTFKTFVLTQAVSMGMNPATTDLRLGRSSTTSRIPPSRRGTSRPTATRTRARSPSSRRRSSPTTRSTRS